MKVDRVLEHFYRICEIPRPSYKEEAISKYMARFAEERNLWYVRDDAGNVIIKKDGVGTGSGKEPLVLQAHIDMVCEADASRNIDMDKEPISLIHDGDRLRADGTTLGSDDGIGMAMMMALLENTDMDCPPLECIFTTAEEVGMDGAKAIDLSCIEGRRMINIDSEDEGVFTTGCAGGGRFDARLSLDMQAPTGTLYEIALSGFTGGHSGTDIDKYSANTSRQLIRILAAMAEETDIEIAIMEGGSKDNAIPRDARAVISVPSDSEPSVLEAARTEFSKVKEQYSVTDPGASMKLEKYSGPALKAATCDCSKKMLALAASLPCGVQRMSRDIEGLPETSLNLGIMTTEDGIFRLSYALRSCVAGAYTDLKRQMTLIAKTFGAEVSSRGEYPAWEFTKDSPLLSIVSEEYKKLENKEPIVTVIHAGLECGLLKEKLPDMDIVSLGPDIRGAHSPSEYLSISSTERVWEHLKNVVQRLI